MMRNFVLLASTLALFVGCSSTPYNHNYDSNQYGWTWTGDLNQRFPASDASIEKCIKRLTQAGCKLSNNDKDRMLQNVDKCRQMKSSSGKTTLELFLLDKAQKLVVIKTDGDHVYKPNCPVTKYQIDGSGIKEMKIVSNKAFMLSDDGQVYFMHADESFYELYNASGKAYSSVTDIKGSSDGQSVTLLFKDGGKAELSHADIVKRIESGKSRKLDFFVYTTERSLFRDE